MVSMCTCQVVAEGKTANKGFILSASWQVLKVSLGASLWARFTVFI